MQSLLNKPPPPGKRMKRIKRTAPRRRVTPIKRRQGRTYFRNMAFVHRQSCEGVKSELDLFAVPPTQTSIEDGRWIEHQPLTSLDSGGPIEFILPGTGDAYIDLANTYLLIRAKVVRAVGTELAPDTPVAPVNNWLHSLFSQVDVYLNDTLVTPSSNTYPFRAYVDTLLSYGAEAKTTQLTSQLWYKDTAGHMDATIADGGNTGLVERRRHISESRVVEMMGRLHVDLFLQDRFILNGVSVKIRLVRSKDAFSLMASGQNPDYKVQIVDAVLFARKAVLSPTVQMAHIKALEKGTAKYPISCGASTTTPTTGNTLKKTSTPSTTPLTSWPSTSTDGRFRRNRSSQTSRPAATFEATSTCFLPLVNKHRTKGTSCRAMNLVKVTPSSVSI